MSLQKVQELQQGSLPPSCTSGLPILLAQSYFTCSKTKSYTALGTHVFDCSRLSSCYQSVASLFFQLFSRNSLSLPSPSTHEAFAKYSFLAFDSLGFSLFLPAKGFLGRLTDITSPSFQNSPETGAMGWELCLS